MTKVSDTQRRILNAASKQPKTDVREHMKELKSPAIRDKVIESMLKNGLIAEDPEADGVVYIISGAGYEAIAAQSGEAAIATVRNEHVDVLLIDLRIPDMRGDVIFELAAAEQPQLRFQTLFMTGDITERAHKLIAACKCHFLRKPFDLRDMTDAVAALAPRTGVQDAAG